MTVPASNVVGCLLGGALGDAFGGIAERGRPCLSDDTQLTLATCESFVATGRVDPAHLGHTFLRWFREGRLSGLGSATLKALRDLEAGAHWALAGARGEMAAGNGAAMRVAPLAFMVDAVSGRQIIRDIARITHHNDEAYLGALAVVMALQGPWPDSAAMFVGRIADELPDSRVGDRLMAVAQSAEILDLRRLAASFGCSGYVVETVPLALVAGWRMAEASFGEALAELAEAGGDTDTISSIAGQIAGARLGKERLPPQLMDTLPERTWVSEVAEKFRVFLESRHAEV